MGRLELGCGWGMAIQELCGGVGQAGAEVGDAGAGVQGFEHGVQGAQPGMRPRGGQRGDHVDGLVADADGGVDITGQRVCPGQVGQVEALGPGVAGAEVIHGLS